MKRYFYYKKGIVKMVSEKPLTKYGKKRFNEREIDVSVEQIRNLSKPLITKIVRGKLVFEESLQERERKLTIEKVLSAKTFDDLKELLIDLVK